MEYVRNVFIQDVHHLIGIHVHALVVVMDINSQMDNVLHVPIYIVINVKQIRQFVRHVNHIMVYHHLLVLVVHRVYVWIVMEIVLCVLLVRMDIMYLMEHVIIVRLVVLLVHLLLFVLNVQLLITYWQMVDVNNFLPNV